MMENAMSQPSDADQQAGIRRENAEENPDRPAIFVDLGTRATLAIRLYPPGGLLATLATRTGEVRGTFDLTPAQALNLSDDLRRLVVASDVAAEAKR
jgi:hypothetical protein